MPKSNKFIRLSAKSFLFSLGLTLVACGGGGGGGGGGNNIPSAAVKYSGETQEANVDSTSAVEITDAYIAASQENVGGQVAGATIISTQQPLDREAKTQLAEQLKQQVLNSFNKGNSTVIGAGVVTGGNCVGNVTGITNDGSISDSVLSQTNTKVTGKLSFNNVCLYKSFTTGLGTEEVYSILNGDVYYTVKGSNLQDAAFVIDSMVLNIPKLTVYFKNITLNKEFTETISEYFSIVYKYNIDGILTGFVLSNYSDIDVSGIVYRFEVVVDTTKGTTIAKFYHPSYGYVTFVDSLTYGGTCGDLPDGGSFVITTATVEYTVTPRATCGTYDVTEVIL